MTVNMTTFVIFFMGHISANLYYRLLSFNSTIHGGNISLFIVSYVNQMFRKIDNFGSINKPNIALINCYITFTMLSITSLYLDDIVRFHLIDKFYFLSFYAWGNI